MTVSLTEEREMNPATSANEILRKFLIHVEDGLALHVVVAWGHLTFRVFAVQRL